jgi:DNA invertase Pin-like site-specific DNA recombinase
MENIISQPPPFPKKKAISYIRWSTKSQGDGDSEERQLKTFLDWCGANDLIPDLQASIRDEGLSAFKGDHLRKDGGLGILLKAIKAGKYPNHVLVAEDLDRISRQGPKKARKIIEQIVDEGVDMHICRSNLKLTPGWENDLPRSIIVDYELGRAWGESQLKSKRILSGLLRNKLQAAKDGQAMGENLPWWIKAKKGQKIDESCLIPERVAAVREMFQLAAKKDMGAIRIIKKLVAKGHKPFTPTTNSKRLKSYGWTPSYVRQILLSKAVLGESPGGIPNRFPAIITQSEWEAVRASVHFKNRNHKGGSEGNSKERGGGPRGGGRTSDATGNLFGSLVRDESRDGPNALRVNKSMWYQPKGTCDHSFMVTFFSDQGIKPNRIRYSHLEEGVLEFLDLLDWKAVAGESEPLDMKEKQKELDSVKTEIYQTEQLIIKWEKEAREMPDSKSLFRAIDGAEEELATLATRRDTLISEIEAIRIETEALHNINELQGLIRENNSEAHEVRMQLKAEIRKRITKIGLQFFRSHVAGKVILGTITFINGTTRQLIFYPEYDCAVIFGAEKKFSHKVFFTPDKNHKLNNSVTRKMFLLHLQGWTNRKISAETGFTALTVGQVINGHIHAEFHGNGAPVTIPGPVVQSKSTDEWLETAAWKSDKNRH